MSIGGVGGRFEICWLGEVGGRRVLCSWTNLFGAIYKLGFWGVGSHLYNVVVYSYFINCLAMYIPEIKYSI